MIRQVIGHLVWKNGGEGHVVTIGPDVVVVRSTVPAPPGSRIEGTLAGTAATLRMKVHVSRRQGQGDFVLEGRPLDLTRETRERLQAMVQSGDAPRPQSRGEDT